MQTKKRSEKEAKGKHMMPDGAMMKNSEMMKTPDKKSTKKIVKSKKSC